MIIKIAARLVAASAAFVVGTFATLSWVGSSTYLSADESPGHGQLRSCQVKEVDLKGRVVWMPCAEWQRRK